MLRHSFCLITGLPDGLFSDKKFQFWFIFVGLGMENLGKFYMATLVLLSSFGVFYLHLAIW
jgi:hypothetical protein